MQKNISIGQRHLDLIEKLRKELGISGSAVICRGLELLEEKQIARAQAELATK